MNTSLKNTFLLLGAAFTLQPTHVTAMQSATRFVEKWGFAAASGFVGYQIQKHGGDYLKAHYFQEKELPTLSQEELTKLTPKVFAEYQTNAAKIGKYNKDIGELPDDTTFNALNFAVDIISPHNKNAKLNAFFAVNSYNFYRSVETVLVGYAQWWSTLTPAKAAMTGAYVSSAIASVVIPEEFKAHPWVKATSRFFSRSYMRSKLLQCLSKEENHKFNKNLADVVELGLGAYYKA